MGRAENIAIFEDTERLVKTDDRLRSSVQQSTKNQKLILETDKLEKPDLERYSSEAEIIVSKKRT